MRWVEVFEKEPEAYDVSVCFLLILPCSCSWVWSGAGEVLGASPATGVMKSLAYKWDCSPYGVQGVALLCIVCVGNRKDFLTYRPRSQSCCDFLNSQ